jgi:hypothetical protein
LILEETGPQTSAFAEQLSEFLDFGPSFWTAMQRRGDLDNCRIPARRAVLNRTVGTTHAVPMWIEVFKQSGQILRRTHLRSKSSSGNARARKMLSDALRTLDGGDMHSRIRHQNAHQPLNGLIPAMSTGKENWHE